MVRSRIFRWALAAIGGLALLGVAACGGRPDLADYADRQPALVLEEYFDGTLTASGLFQDRFQDVRRAFTVEVDGRWDGERLTLVEDFVYEDGSEERRTWLLTKTGPTTWEGTAEGVVGVATGEVRGNAFNFRYTFDLERPNGDTLRVSFDDWMFRLDGRDVVNRAYVSWNGIQIGELSIFFRREE